MFPSDAKLVVKHTFLEMVMEPADGTPGRRRTLSDTELSLPETPTSRSCQNDFEDILSNVTVSTHAEISGNMSEMGDDITPKSGSVAAVKQSETNEANVGPIPEKTTVMLRNVPYNCSRDSVVKMMDEAGLCGLYNFIYLPIDFRSRSGFGYAFINMVSCEAAEKFFRQFNGFSVWPMRSQKIAEVTWSEPSQGLHVHVERYRNSPVMHDAVPDEFKPAMYENGIRVAFPAPTKAIRVPRFRRR